MTNREFLIWLLGYLDLCIDDVLNRKKLFIIKNHMNLVKAVEGQFDAVNTCIWDSVVSHLEKNTDEKDLAVFKSELSDILAKA